MSVIIPSAPDKSAHGRDYSLYSSVGLPPDKPPPLFSDDSMPLRLLIASTSQHEHLSEQLAAAFDSRRVRSIQHCAKSSMRILNLLLGLFKPVALL